MATRSKSAVSLKIDMREFNKVLPKYLEHNRRSLQEIVNFKLKAIAFDAIDTTKAARADKIREALGQTATRIAYRRGAGRERKLLKTPKPVFGRDARGAYAIVTAWAKKRGVTLPRPGLRSFVERQRGRRISGVGFIKSGWIPAAEKMKRVASAKGYARRPLARPKKYGKNKGGAIPAPVGAKTWGAIWNKAILPLSKHSYHMGNPMAHARRGLQVAFNNEVASMVLYITKKLQPVADKYRGK